MRTILIALLCLALDSACFAQGRGGFRGGFRGGSGGRGFSSHGYAGGRIAAKGFYGGHRWSGYRGGHGWNSRGGGYGWSGNRGGHGWGRYRSHVYGGAKYSGYRGWYGAPYRGYRGWYGAPYRSWHLRPYGWGHRFGIGIGIGYWSWYYWPDCYWDYYGYGYPYSYWYPYISYPAVPSAAVVISSSEPASAAPGVNQADVDAAAWHRFGDRVSASTRSPSPPSGRTAETYLNDGKWHRFGEGAAPEAVAVLDVETRVAHQNRTRTEDRIR